MKRAERQYALVDVLRGAHRPWSAARLAREFGVSSRTIERDIASLQVSGVPIYADHGAAGGYSVLGEYSLPPLNLSEVESLAVLAGLALLESSPYRGAAVRAHAKVAAVMQDAHRARVQELLGAMHVIDAVPPESDAVSLDILSTAIAARRVLRLGYVGDVSDAGPDRSSITVRDVEPQGLLRAADTWLLTGWCRLRDAVRGFRIERIRRLEILDETPPRRDPALLEADLAQWSARRLA
ncbi:helix-turn-helix transcriptional regulator [Rhodococcoides yunnanense]|uniref:helix-turn-helix transcriptional regulator n=1 Tax=Rhodococcoides yunnanense TaxID=278209 RepID=UPI0009351CB4|nr:YafY family protein [Rhodococcus yunnanensis]